LLDVLFALSLSSEGAGIAPAGATGDESGEGGREAGHRAITSDNPRYYVTGIPCRHGHIAPRLKTTKDCTECLKARRKTRNHEANRVATIAWKKANPEKVREHQRNLYRRQRKKLLETPGYTPPDRKRLTPEQREDRRLKGIAASKRWAKERPEYNVLKTIRWQKRYPERQRALRMNRRARMKGAQGSHTGQEVLDLLKSQKSLCVYCRISLKKKYHKDHIVALAKGGTNDIKNIQLLCPTCNMRKNAKDPVRFAQEMGMLL
jgi:5-methylcytosine-specific restriction endonuclease McrA